MIEVLDNLDRELFLFLNSLHTPGLDSVMYLASEKLTWVPLYVLLLYLVVKKFGRNSWIPIIAITVMIVVSDQTNTAILKPIFQRLRPSHNPELESFVHIVNDHRGGKYGFASSHASNTFATALFFYLMFGSTYRWIIVLFGWAAFVSYSRIYLGLHYPGDVLAGILVGLASAAAAFRLQKWMLAYWTARHESARHPK